jgi:deoxyuridine 5'-triphosphate nucleotidohydrolase
MKEFEMFVYRHSFFKYLYSRTRKGDANPNSSRLTDLQRFFHDRAVSCNRRGVAKGLDSNITYLDLEELYYTQNGKCYYSNVTLTFKGKQDPNYLSVDRIDPTKGYTKDNLVLCAIACNFLKSNYEFISLYPILKGLFTTMSTQIVKYRLLNEQAKKHNTDAGLDVIITSVEAIPGGYICGTGLSVQPPPGFHFELICRSSTYKKGLALWNGVGVIDNEYTGEIKAVFKAEANHIVPQVGDRLLQLVLRHTLNVEFIETPSLLETERNSGGFGSTGNGALGYGKL